MATNPLIAALRGASTAPAKASGYSTVSTPWAKNTPNKPYEPRITFSTVNRDVVPKRIDNTDRPDPTLGTEGYWEDLIVPPIEGFGGGGSYINWVPGTKPGGDGTTTGGGGTTTGGDGTTTGGDGTTTGGDGTDPLTQRQAWEKMVTDYTIARDAAGQNDNAFLSTPAGQNWIGTRDTNIAKLRDINLLNKYKDEFKLQSTIPGVEDVGASGYANTLKRLAQLSGNST